MFKKFYIEFQELAKKQIEVHTSHSVDEGKDLHAFKPVCIKAKKTVHEN